LLSMNQYLGRWNYRLNWSHSDCCKHRFRFRFRYHFQYWYYHYYMNVFKFNRNYYYLIICLSYLDEDLNFTFLCDLAIFLLRASCLDLKSFK
jgi:hypothetical protein